MSVKSWTEKCQSLFLALDPLHIFPSHPLSGDSFLGNESCFPFTRHLRFHLWVCVDVYICPGLCQQAKPFLPSSFLSSLSFPTMPCLKLSFQRKKVLYLCSLACKSTLERSCFVRPLPEAFLELWEVKCHCGMALCFQLFTQSDLTSDGVTSFDVLYVLLGSISVFSCEYDLFVVVNTLGTVYPWLLCPISISLYSVFPITYGPISCCRLLHL